MSVKTTYTCNLCCKEIDKGKSIKDGRDCGFALIWRTKFGDKPRTRELLEVIQDWINCPFHLCHECIDAVADFRDSLKDDK